MFRCSATVISFGLESFGKNGATKFTALLNLFFIIGTIYIYIASIVKLKIYQKTSGMVSANTRSLDSLITVYLAIITITFTPMAVFIAGVVQIEKEIGDRDTIIIFHGFHLLTGLNSSLNILAYLKLNAKAKRKINSMMQMNIVSNGNDESGV